MEIVIPEHRDNRHTQAVRRLGERLGLLGLTLRRQIAGEQDEIRLALDGGERLGNTRTGRLGGVQIPGCGDPHHGLMDELEIVPP